MKFKSTRGGVAGVSFEEAVLSGCASDGGLFMPESLPKLTREELGAWSSLSYPQMVEKLLRIFVDQDEMTDEEIKGVMDGCYSKFDDPNDVISMVQFGDLSFAELWHGPTGAFKDLSLVILARVVNFFLEKRDERSVVLVSTSGDTGSAAIHSALGMQRLQLMVMYPRHMVSRTQELQMTTISSPNVRVFSVDGTSDDTDVVMTSVFADLDFSRKHNVNVFNSLNICRVLVQSIHFFYVYLRLCPEVDQDVLFSVPTGGLGNISSGMLARQMGLPVKFLAAVNENDTVSRTLKSGVYRSPSGIHKTLSCAMDINIPYNMERIFFCLSGGNSKQVKEIMEEFEKEGVCALPPLLMSANDCISSACVLEEGLISTMQEVWKQHGYLLCPHTAVATRAALDLLGKKGRKEGSDDVTVSCQKLAVICTATPAKFTEAVKRAGLPPPPSSAKFDSLSKLPERKLYMNQGEDWCKIMKQAIEEAWDS